MNDRFEIVPFHEHQIMTVKTDDAVRVVMKPIVEALGLTWQGQLERMKRHYVISKGISVTLIPSAGGMQEAVTLDLEQFHGWLVTLVPDRIKDEEKRDLIIRYQTDAFRVVFEHFHGKIGRPPRTMKSIGVTISTQKQALHLARQLQATCHPTERRMIHQMLDAMCQEIGIDTPPLHELGSDAPLVPDMLDKFWRAIETLQERGHDVNMSRKSGLIALYLRDVSRLFTEERLNVRIDADMRMALEQSIMPRFIANKSVNCRDGKARHCWVFDISCQG